MKFRSYLQAIFLFICLPFAALGLVVFLATSDIPALAPLKKQIQTLMVVISGQPQKETPAFEAAPPQNENVIIAEDIKTEEAQKVLELDNDPSSIPMEFADPSISMEDVLYDRFDRIPEVFKVTRSFSKRVGFWLNIYTKYSSRFSVIHDADSPWLIYQVVDLRPIHGRKDLSPIAKNLLADREVSRTFGTTKKLLLGLSKKNSKSKLTDEEKRLVRILAPTPKNWKTTFAEAYRGIRIQLGQKDFYRKGLVSGSRYLNEMETIFAKYDLPTELCRLPLVESSFNEQAVSKVGASGVWQFMPGMGKKFLKVGPVIDERNSPIKATEAAAQLMLSNFQLLKNWPLAITAYNHGPGGLMKAMKKHKISTLAEIIEKHDAKAFGFASQNFYSEFIAALHGEKYSEEIFGDVGKHPSLIAEEIVLKRATSVQGLITRLGLTLEELKLYNPELKSKAINRETPLPPQMRIRVPREVVNRMKENEQSSHFFRKGFRS